MLIEGEGGPGKGQSLAAWMDLLDTRRRQAVQWKRATGGMLWHALVTNYTEEFESQSLARENNQRITIARLQAIAGAFPNRRPDDITPRDWDAWLDTRTCGAITVNKFRSIVSRIYKHGLRKHVVESNPIERVAVRRRPRTVVRPTYRTQSMLKRELDRRSHTEAEAKELMRWRVLDEEEQRELVELVMERSHLGMLVPVLLGLHGVSGIDIRQMRKGAYDAKTGIVSGQRSKTGTATFNVPIAPAVKPHVDRYFIKVKSGELAFPQFHTREDGKPTSDPKDNFLRAWKRVIKESDFVGLRFHALRHSYISTMLARGVRAEQVAKFSAHIDIRTVVDLYGHFLPDESVKLVASLKLFEGVG
ncbi:MAG: tyrosine-type recombinase/integrase [Planctomycetes bacterium]|nr:tyrosine-type recombinase/integrase [Planctomycetota bacterium]